MLDKIAPEWRHLILMLAAALLGWASDNLLNMGLPPMAASMLGVVVAAGIAWLTPITRQYGVGRKQPVLELEPAPVVKKTAAKPVAKKTAAPVAKKTAKKAP